MEGFLRKPAGLGLSDVETDVPDPSEGVRIVDEEGRTSYGRDIAAGGSPAGVPTDVGTTKVLFDAAPGLYLAAVGDAALSVLLVPCPVLFDGVMLLLAFFASLDTCCAGLLRSSFVSLILGLNGMRLLGLR